MCVASVRQTVIGPVEEDEETYENSSQSASSLLFSIYGMEQRTVSSVKAELGVRMSGLVETRRVPIDTAFDLNCERKVMALTSNSVIVNIGKCSLIHFRDSIVLLL